MKNHLRLVFFVGLFLTFAVGLSAGGRSATGEETLFESPLPIGDPAFSKDGGAIAWTVGEPGKRELQYLTLADHKPGKVTGLNGDMVSPTFSIDGKRIYFCVREKDNFDLAEFDLDSLKSRVLMRTPEDEFRVECPKSYFTSDTADDPENPKQKKHVLYEKLFFLCGKNGTGELRSMHLDRKPPRYFSNDPIWNVATSTDGILMMRIATGSFNGFSLGGEPSSILLENSAGPQKMDYVYSETDNDLLGVSIPFETPHFVKAREALSGIVFAPNSAFAIGRKGRDLYRLKLDDGEASTLGLPSDSGFAADPHTRRIARVEKRGSGFALMLTPCPAKDLFIVNGHHSKLRLASSTFELIQKNDFAVVPGTTKQFFDLYESNRYEGLESFISADAVYFLFHLFYDYELISIEKGAFRKDLAEITRALATEAGTSYSKARSPEAKVLMKKLWSLFWAAHLLGKTDDDKLLHAAGELPEQIRDAVKSDLDLILKASDISESKILGRTVDFSLFKPRGHYEKSPDLRSYFRTIVLLGQIPLKVFDDDSDKADKPSADISAIGAMWVIGSRAAIGGKPVIDVLKSISGPLDYLVGQTEDVSFIRLSEVLKGLTAPANPDGLLAEGFRAQVFDRLKTFPKPKVRSFKSLEKNSPPETSNVYVLFFPARFTLDSYVMQNLVYKAVGTDDNARMLPKSLDMAAAFGSNRAEQILLEVFKEGRFSKYTENLGKMRKEMDALPAAEWTGNLYRGWLKTFRDLLALEMKGVEPFTKTNAWSDRILNTVFGSWTTLRHDTILYNKMSAAERGDGGETEDYLVRGIPDVYVDPYPKLFADLKRMVDEMTGKLDQLGYLPKEEVEPKSEEADRELKLTARGLAKEFSSMLAFLNEVAGKQAKGTALTNDEKSRLFDFGGTLERLTIGYLRSEDTPPYASGMQEEVSLIADVAAGLENPFSSKLLVLEEAIGRVFPIYVLHDRGAGPKLYRGGVFSFYEFEQPASNRLSDSQWKKMIQENKQPPLPVWTDSFISPDRSSAMVKEKDGGDSNEGGDEEE